MAKQKIIKIVAPRGLESQGLSSPVAAPAQPLTYRGGHLLTKVEVFTIFWGVTWTTAQTTQINQFFTAIVQSPLIDQMTEYNVTGQTIGHGSFIGSKTLNSPALKKTVTDTTIQTNLKKWIAAGTVPTQTPNRLYFVFTQSGTVVKLGKDASCQVFCGYHDHINKQIFYAVIPFPDCTGCTGGLSAFDSMTVTASHELCEAITDAVPGEGWYNNVNGEVGDYCRTTKKIGVYTVQTEFSNQANACK